MEIQENVSLAPYTTLKVGGPARYVARVTSTTEVKQAGQFAVQNDLPVLVLGHGSNVLIPDVGYKGLVVINEIMFRTYVDQPDGSVFVTFGAGEHWDEVVESTVERGLWGFENLSHIPGTVGATPIQNVGAYGVEVSDRVVSVEAVSLTTGEQQTFSSSDCQFGYRDSYFKTDEGRKWIIISVTYCLSNSPEAAVLTYADLHAFAGSQIEFSALDIRNEIIRIRSAKFPNWAAVGTAGSFFKNPTVTREELQELLLQYPELPNYPQSTGKAKVSLGWILDKVCGLRGYSDGQVELSTHQALVLINHGDSATAVSDFVQQVTRAVYEKTKIVIEPEVRFV